MVVMTFSKREFNSYVHTSWDWHILVPRSIRLAPDIYEKLDKLNPDYVYGFSMHTLDGEPTLDEIILFVPHKIVKQLGGLTSDMSYSHRALDAGFGICVLEKEGWFAHGED